MLAGTALDGGDSKPSDSRGPSLFTPSRNQLFTISRAGHGCSVRGACATHRARPSFLKPPHLSSRLCGLPRGWCGGRREWWTLPVRASGSPARTPLLRTQTPIVSLDTIVGSYCLTLHLPAICQIFGDPVPSLPGPRWAPGRKTGAQNNENGQADGGSSSSSESTATWLRCLLVATLQPVRPPGQDTERTGAANNRTSCAAQTTLCRFRPSNTDSALSRVFFKSSRFTRVSAWVTCHRRRDCCHWPPRGIGQALLAE